MQDKRAVVPLAPAAFKVWLRGTIEEAAAALQLPSVEVYNAGPEQSLALPGSKLSAQNPDQLSLL